MGAGNLVDTKTARHCWDAGATFLTSDGFVSEVIDLAIKKELCLFPGP